MAKSICLRCGAAKASPWRKCRRCGFTPEAEEDSLVKSVYLSVGRFDDPDRAAAYESELDELAKRIRAGSQPEFDPGELARLREQKHAVEGVPMSAVWGAVLRFFLPGVGLLLGLLLILYLLRSLR